MPTTLFAIIFACVALVFVALGWPLLRGRVKRNGLYGFRTVSSLADDAIWYPTNRFAGWSMFIAGGVLLITVGVMFLLNVPGNVFAAICLAIVFAGTGVAAIGGFVLQQRLLAARSR